jgi:hypothetical protein
MGKRSTRIAKRDDFENTLSSMEKALGASLGKGPKASAPARSGGKKTGKPKPAHWPKKK